ncbi:2987_t:CDS:1, partial [Rhizophagus irregularis]
INKTELECVTILLIQNFNVAEDIIIQRQEITRDFREIHSDEEW